MTNQIINQIDELAAINKQISALKQQKEKIEAEITKQCSKDLENTKYKSIAYAATSAGLKAVNAESLKITYPSFLPFVFANTYKDAVKETTAYKLSAATTRMIIGLWKGNYVRSTVADVIESMPVSVAVKEQLTKKVKGINYDGDVKVIRKFAETMSLDDAKEYAYMAAEAAVWQDFCSMLTINGVTKEQEISDIINKIRSAFVVEDTTKIIIEEYV